MIFFKKILFVVVIVMTTSGTASIGMNNKPGETKLPVDLLEKKLKAYENESWKSTNVAVDGNEQTLEAHLMAFYNANDWGPHKSLSLTEEADHAEIATLLAHEYGPPVTLFKCFNTFCAKCGDKKTRRITQQNVDAILRERITSPLSGELLEHCNAHSNKKIAANTSPREVMRMLNIEAFKKFAQANPDLINNENYATDDLVKARALCGVFWVFVGRCFRGGFSGMLVPGQEFNSESYSVHSSRHSALTPTENVILFHTEYSMLNSPLILRT
ncbi:MAG: hypothetical protein LBJ67_17080 [Planctomycetaceae bacterium]|jgi:hypothetical protein|nr:hypothetical protein [Planctomycetaceae bacterium]